MSDGPLGKVIKHCDDGDLCGCNFHNLLIKVTIIKQGGKKSPSTPIWIIYKMQILGWNLESVLEAMIFDAIQCHLIINLGAL